MIKMSNTSDKSFESLREVKTYHLGAIEAAAHRALRQHKDELLKPYKITGIEWYLIGIVYDSGSEGIRSTDLAKELGTTMSFLTKTVNLLEAKNILHRRANAKDARSTYVVLNDKYIPTCEEIELHLRRELRKSIYSLVTPEELRTYIRVMERFSKLW
ncbi:MAG TPA: MarR family transcriptional regulator [Candidatus Saccharimonadales bacterium]|nr:MarR family transcriptional regulator [Candidatus Saccharimonadales bacterium]